MGRVEIRAGSQRASPLGKHQREYGRRRKRMARDARLPRREGMGNIKVLKICCPVLRSVFWQRISERRTGLKNEKRNKSY